jgi:hypothetical protein
VLGSPAPMPRKHNLKNARYRPCPHSAACGPHIRKMISLHRDPGNHFYAVAGGTCDPSVVTGMPAWREVRLLVAPEVGEPVSGAGPLVPARRSGTTWPARAQRTGAIVVKVRHGDRAYEKTRCCAAHLLALGARVSGSGDPVARHDQRSVARDRPEPATWRTCCSTTGTRCEPMRSGLARRPGRCVRDGGAGSNRSGGCGCQQPTMPTTT